MTLCDNFNVVGLHSSARKRAQSANDSVSQNLPPPVGSWSLPESALPSRSKIPSASLFKNLSEPPPPVPASAGPGAQVAQLPTPAECAVHLELLQTYYYLKRNVLESKELDTAWEIAAKKPSGQPLSKSEFASNRALKWPLFKRLAALRFLDWLIVADSHLSTTYSDPGTIDAPPLDILMAWHALLLNPQSFRDFCERHGYRHIRNVPFPWEGVHALIDNRDWKFTMSSDPAMQQDTLKTHDLFGYLCRTDRSKLVHDMIADLLDANLSERDIGRVIGRNEDMRVTDKDFIKSCCKNMQLDDTLEAADEIAEAIERQTSFVDKMEDQLWISSPAVAATLQRAVDRYSKFLKLLKLYPDTTLSPTLDIDLVWHTHQCSASRYESDMHSLVGRFIDHNDKLSTSVLSPATKRTARLWRVRFGQEYNVCLCWDCQALLSAAMETVEHQRERGLCSTEGVDTDSVAHTVGDYLTYYRFMEVARRLHRPIVPGFSSATRAS